jgi:hypothetical protein
LSDELAPYRVLVNVIASDSPQTLTPPTSCTRPGMTVHRSRTPCGGSRSIRRPW